MAVGGVDPHCRAKREEGDESIKERFRLGVENECACAGRGGEPVSRDQFLRRERGRQGTNNG